MQLKLVTIKIWGVDMQRMNITQIKDFKHSNRKWVNSTAFSK